MSFSALAEYVQHGIIAPQRAPSSACLHADALSTPRHVQVMAYLRAFAEHYDLLRHIQYRTGVKHIRPLQQEAPSNGSKPKYTWPRWQLHLQHGSEVQSSHDHTLCCAGRLVMQDSASSAAQGTERVCMFKTLRSLCL